MRDWSFAVKRWYSTNEPDGTRGPLHGCLPKTSFIERLPIRQQICDVSQIGVAFHGICPPTFIYTRLQQYSRGAFLHSAHCSFRNTMSLRSVWGRRAMIPGEIFTSFAEFQGIVSVNDFWFPLGFQELLQASLGFLWSFRFCTDTPGSIEWLDPAPRLHIDDCFEIRNCCLGPCDLLRTLWSAVIKSPKFAAQGTASPLRLLHGALAILVRLQISQFRSAWRWV